MTSHPSELAPLVGRDRADYGVARLRDQAFDAIQHLWRKRRDEGVTQKHLAEIINRDRGWVSKNLRAPGNWTLRTIGELAQALDGEIEIRIAGIEEPLESRSNFNAYEMHVRDDYVEPHPRKADGVIKAAMSIDNGAVNLVLPDSGQIRSLKILDQPYMQVVS
jgi:transcriptional regulator with XRE-family HTH domain